MSTSLMVAEQLCGQFSYLTLDTSGDMPAIIVSPDHLIDTIKRLSSDPNFGFTFLTDLCGVHYPDQSPPVLGVIYHLHNLVLNARIRVKCFVPVTSPIVPTLTGLFSSANWMERETYDFYGVQFSGHPELTRILNEDSLQEFPLRKEFKLEDPTRTDKKDEYFGR